MTQTHDHDHGAHAPIQSSSGVNEFEVLELAVRELAIEKGLFSTEDHRRFSEWAESIGPSGGSKLVAKAWVDPEFKTRLLADGTEACKEVAKLDRGIITEEELRARMDAVRARLTCE